MLRHFQAALALAMIASPAVVAHVQMSDPVPLFSDVTYANSPVGTFDGASVMAPPSGMSYSEGAAENLAAFTESFNASTWTSVLELVTDSMTLESYVSDRTCGITDPTYEQALPATYIKWTGTTHVGPCEVWCDDVRVFYDLNCGTNYPADAVPYDRSQCTDKSVLKLLFLAIHNPTWEVFLDCVGIDGGSTTSSVSSSVASSSSATTSSTSESGSAATSSSDTTAAEASTETASSVASATTESPAAASTSTSTPTSGTSSTPSSGSSGHSVNFSLIKNATYNTTKDCNGRVRAHKPLTK